MKTQQELMQAYWGPGGTVDMVKEYNAKHGCDVKPWECVKYEGNSSLWRGDHPRFDGQHYSYTFALTILYDDKLKKHRPVFVGDKLYVKINGEETRMEVGGSSIVNSVITAAGDRVLSYLSWNPPTPKRTFKLNDVELPCPEKRNEGGFNTFVCGESFLFDTLQDCSEFKTKLMALLTAARDKE